MSETVAACHHSFQGKLCLETKGEKTNDPIFFLMNTSPTSNPAKASGGGEMPGKGTGQLACITSALLFCFSFFFLFFFPQFCPLVSFSSSNNIGCPLWCLPGNYRNLPDSTQQVEATTAATTRAPSVPAVSGTAAGPPLMPWPYQAHRSQSKHIALNLKKKKKNLHSYQDCDFRF